MDKDDIAAAHRQQTSQEMSPVARRLFKFIEFDPDETMIAEIRKHPIGFIALGIGGVLISLLILIGSSALAFNLDRLGITDGQADGALKAGIIGVGLLVSILVIVVTAISIVLYRLCVVYVTSQKVAEVAYISLFNRKITQLGMGQIEDVTDHKRGIFSYIFNYGTLIIETAGELENATFTIVPNVNFYSQQIIQAHERYIGKYGTVR